MTRGHSTHLAGYFTVGTIALFIVGFLMLVIFGAHIYQETVAGQQKNMDTRAQLSYFATILRDNDTAGAVSVEGTAGAPVLTVRDGDSGYAFRIYLYEGQLVEEFSETDAPLDPESGQVIGKTNTFAVEKDGAGLRIATDAGSVTVYLRAEGGAQ